MNIPTELKYTPSHEWVQFISETTARVGITDYAQEALGDIVFVNLPEIGDTVTAKEAFGDTESVKAVSDLISPLSGQVSAVNEELMDSPEKVNEDCYAAWMIEVSAIEGQEELMDAEAYAAFLKTQE